MSRTYRTLKAHGTCTPGTRYQVSVKESAVTYGRDCLFAFTSPTDFHGSYSVVVKVETGRLHITGFTARYPALFGHICGFAVFPQPITNPMLFLQGNQVQQRSLVTIQAGQTFEYEHIMFNGPTRFLIRMNCQAKENQEVYLGDLLTKSYSPSVVDFEMEYEYDRQPNSLHSIQDVDLLRNLVIAKLKNTVG